MTRLMIQRTTRSAMLTLLDDAGSGAGAIGGRDARPWFGGGRPTAGTCALTTVFTPPTVVTTNCTLSSPRPRRILRRTSHARARGRISVPPGAAVVRVRVQRREDLVHEKARGGAHEKLGHSSQDLLQGSLRLRARPDITPVARGGSADRRPQTARASTTPRAHPRNSQGRAVDGRRGRRHRDSALKIQVDTFVMTAK